MTMQANSRLTSVTHANQPQSFNFVERLPFTVKAVANEEELQKAVGIRYLAYARHVPEFAEQLTQPEAGDFDPGSVVLVAESKLDGTALGTMRIQTNYCAPLELEESVQLPEWLQGNSLAEATRLGVTDGREGRLVKTVLFKAYFLYCQQTMVDWMVITARKPLDRQYDALLFKDVISGGEFIPMHHVGNMPHRVMAFDVATAEERWIAARHPLYTFIFKTSHPDIDLPPSRLFKSAIPEAHGHFCSRNTMEIRT